MRKKYLKIKLYSTIKMVQTKSQSSKNVLKAKDSKSKTKTKSKASKKTSSKKETTPVVEETAPVVEETPAEPAPAPAPVVEESSPVSTEQSSEDVTEQEVAFEGLCTMVIDLQQQLRALNTQIKQLQKSYKKEVKELKRKCKKPKKGAEGSKKRAPSGFAKPTYLSTKLCKFLDVPSDTMLARTEVTRKVNAYIKEHGLQNPKNKKEILADKSLKNILILEKGVPLTYFNLQKAIKTNFSSTPFEVSA